METALQVGTRGSTALALDKDLCEGGWDGGGQGEAQNPVLMSSGVSLPQTSQQ